MTRTKDSRAEAREALEGYASNFAIAFRCRDAALGDGPIPDNDLGIEDQDSAEEFFYPLSLEFDMDRGEVRAILCTGGPHYEIRWRQDRQFARDVWFLALPWFGREEFRGREVPYAIRRYAEEQAEFVDEAGGITELPGYDADYVPEDENYDDDED